MPAVSPRTALARGPHTEAPGGRQSFGEPLPVDAQLAGNRQYCRYHEGQETPQSPKLDHRSALGGDSSPVPRARITTKDGEIGRLINGFGCEIVAEPAARELVETLDRLSRDRGVTSRMGHRAAVEARICSQPSVFVLRSCGRATVRHR